MWKHYFLLINWIIYLQILINICQRHSMCSGLNTYNSKINFHFEAFSLTTFKIPLTNFNIHRSKCVQKFLKLFQTQNVGTTFSPSFSRILSFVPKHIKQQQEPGQLHSSQQRKRNYQRSLLTDSNPKPNGADIFWPLHSILPTRLSPTSHERR